MALLHQPLTDRLCSPGARCLVGRSRACALILPEPTVSGEHAVVFHTFSERWAVRDLGSRNGTFVQEQRLAAGDVVELQAGQQLRFGRHSSPWVLLDDRGPGPVGWASGQRVQVALDGVLVLPDEAQPLTWISRVHGLWVAEGESGPALPAVDGMVLPLLGVSWRLLLPRGSAGVALDTTMGHSLGPTIEDVSLDLRVSHDARFVQVVCIHGGTRTEMPARACHRLVLELARARLADRASGLEEADCGWMHPHQLQERLGASQQKLHVDVLRCRRQLGALGVRNADNLFEHRRTTREIRLGVAELVLTRLSAPTS